LLHCNPILKSQQQNSSLVIEECGDIISAADRTVECHDERNYTVDLLGGFLLICLDVPRRIGANE